MCDRWIARSIGPYCKSYDKRRHNNVGKASVIGFVATCANARVLARFARQPWHYLILIWPNRTSKPQSIMGRLGSHAPRSPFQYQLGARHCTQQRKMSVMFRFHDCKLICSRIKLHNLFINLFQKCFLCILVKLKKKSIQCIVLDGGGISCKGYSVQFIAMFL